jgi:L-threonylcarbamoyladenylate synthase
MKRPDPLGDEIEKIAACLLGGGIALLPTDTVYGLAVHPAFPESVERLFRLKQRSRSRQLPVMIASEDELAGLGVHVTEAAPWLAGREEVAVRIPDDERMLAVLRRTGPLLVTSANRHGSATPESLADALAQLDGRPDVAIDGGILNTVPSTLVNCRRDPPVVEREGAVPATELMALLR